MTRRELCTLMLSAPLTLVAADAANMSGHWVLDTKRSKWGKKRAPQTVFIDIQHNEPKYKYDGSVTQDVEGQPQQFHFDGAIDGKEYRVKEDNAERKMVVTRKNANTIASTITSLDGKSTEKTTTTISRDGKTLTRDITLDAPEGRVTWIEVYTKQ